MPDHIKEIPASDAWKFFNIGGTVLVEGKVDNDIDVMPASWCVPIDYDKLGIVLAHEHYTRQLIEKSGYFLLALPMAKSVKKVLYLGSKSKADEPLKVENSGLKLVDVPGAKLPLPEDCIAWAICKDLKDTEIKEKYELFIGEVVQAFVDDRFYKDGEPQFGKIEKEFSPMPYGGSEFFVLGEVVPVDVSEKNP